MCSQARRLTVRPLQRWLRRAPLALCLWLTPAGLTGPAGAESAGQGGPGDVVRDARYSQPTSRYAHGVLGDAVEWAALIIVAEGRDSATGQIEVELPSDHVFEDLEPRLVDLNLDGQTDAVMVVETDMARGAALALYGVGGKIAETPHIGQSNRWLAPIGAADLDGDGHVEIAYIDRPHLARTLRVWRFVDGALVEVASAPGLTNHRIGEDFITGGIRDCEGRPEMITVNAGWSRIIASTFTDGTISQTDLGPFHGRGSVQAALACD